MSTMATAPGLVYDFVWEHITENTIDDREATPSRTRVVQDRAWGLVCILKLKTTALSLYPHPW